MQKRKYIIIGLMTLMLIIGIKFFISNHKQNEVEEDTLLYLTEKGYDIEKSIIAVEVYKIIELSGNEVEFNGDYEVAITFKDEPKVDYVYAYKKGTKDIQQMSVISKGADARFKHKESEKVDVLY